MDMLSRVNWVDILVVIIMLRTVYISFQDGLSYELFPLFGSVLNLVLSLHFYDKLGLMLHSKASLIPVSICNLASFIVIALTAGFVLNLVKGLVDTIVKVIWHPLVEKVGGMLVGILKGAIIISMVLIFLALVPLSYLQWAIKDKSFSGMLFLRIGPAIYWTISGGNADDEKMIQSIVSKKDISAKDIEAAKNRPEWEKVLSAK